MGKSSRFILAPGSFRWRGPQKLPQEVGPLLFPLRCWLEHLETAVRRVQGHIVLRWYGGARSSLVQPWTRGNTPTKPTVPIMLPHRARCSCCWYNTGRLVFLYCYCEHRGWERWLSGGPDRDTLMLPTFFMCAFQIGNFISFPSTNIPLGCILNIWWNFIFIHLKRCWFFSAHRYG